MGLHAAEARQNLRQCLAVAVVIAIVAIFLQIGGDGVRDNLAFSRADLDSGQLWRLVTGHFVHLGWPHLILNLAGLALVAYLVGNTFDRFNWGYIAFVSIAVIDAGFWYLNPGLDWYVGLSGLLHGLLAAGLFVGVLRRDRESIVLAVFVLAKLAWEQISGPLPGSEASSGGVVIVDAHLYGALGGLLAAMLLRRRVEPAAPI
jgi:rhomboid family GlyGly-CTERM serine protease